MEIVDNAKAEVYIGYTWVVDAAKDANWARIYYDDLCAIERPDPLSVYCIPSEQVGANSFLKSKVLFNVDYQKNLDESIKIYEIALEIGF